MTAKPTRRQTQEERRNESDARMVDAALELFARQGYRQTTLIQIGQAAGYTGTLVSNRFGSKDKLLRAVLTHILDRFDHGSREAATDGQDTPPEQLLSDYVELYLTDVDDRRSRIRALHVIMGEALGGLPEVQDQIVQVNRLFRKHIAGYIELGVKKGRFRADLEVDEAAILIVGLLRGVTMQALAEPDRISVRPLIGPMQDAVLSIVAKQASPRRT